MKGISSKVTKALPTQAKLDCADNTGAKVVQLINVLKKGALLEDILQQVLEI